MVMLARTCVAGVTSRMIKDNSRIEEMKDRRKPEIKPLRIKGKTIRRKRVQALAPATSAASSSSLLTCSMADTPERLENGRFLATETITSSAKVPYRAGIGPTGFANMEMYTAPKAIPGMTYGTNASSSTILDR